MKYDKYLNGYRKLFLRNKSHGIYNMFIMYQTINNKERNVCKFSNDVINTIVV